MIKTIIDNEYSFLRKQPLNIRPSDQHLFTNASNSTTSAITVTSANNVDVLDDTLYKFSRFCFLKGTHTHKLGRRRVINALGYYLKPDVVYLDKGIWITNNYSFAYYHWIMECLTRLMVAKNFINNHKVILPTKFQKLSFVEESLKLLGFDVYYYDTKKRLRVRELLVPADAMVFSSFHPLALNLLRDAFSNVKTGASAPTKYTYISRKLAWSRRIVNEDELLPVFAKHNIEVHNLEEYTFLQQLQLLQSTKILIGPHGAGLTNMLLMSKEHSKIIELRNSDDTGWNTFYALAVDLGYDYLYFLGTPTSSEIHDASNTHDADLHIDVLEFDRFLSQWLTEYGKIS